MRIISGTAGGTPLKAPSGLEVRPTSDRVKEALFSSLGDIRDWTVADFFAGSGSLGLEALSRGAKKVVFVENAPRSVSCIRENIKKASRSLPSAAIADIRILRANVVAVPKVLPEFEGRIDLILADPPYRPGPDDFGALKMLQDQALAKWAQGAILVLEHAPGTPLPWHPASPWQLLKQRRFGTQTISFARVAEEVAELSPTV